MRWLGLLSLLFVTAASFAADAAADPAKLAEIEKLGKQDTDPARAELLKIVQSGAAHEAEREAAVKALASSRGGALAILGLADKDQLPEELVATASFACASSQFEDVRKAAESKLPLPKSKDGLPLPTVDKLLAMKGDAAEGAKAFRNAQGGNCVSCHQIGEEGKMIGPPLTTIGEKLSKQQLYEAILTPSAGILMGYENWVVKTKAGAIFSGILAENTEDHITIKDTQGKYNDIPADDVAKKVKQTKSMMPEDLVKTMTQQELVNLVEYLSRLKYTQP